MDRLLSSQIDDITNCLTKMEREKIILIKRGVHYSGFDDVDRIVDMQLVDKTTGMLSAVGHRVFDSYPRNRYMQY